MANDKMLSMLLSSTHPIIKIVTIMLNASGAKNSVSTKKSS